MPAGPDPRRTVTLPRALPLGALVEIEFQFLSGVQACA